VGFPSFARRQRPVASAVRDILLTKFRRAGTEISRPLPEMLKELEYWNIKEDYWKCGSGLKDLMNIALDIKCRYTVCGFFEI
jgi:hypothetical protein